MSMTNRLIASAALAAVTLSVPAASRADDPNGRAAAVDRQAMTSALAQSNRAGDRARDAWRHPAQTLAFFRVAPGMTVVDYMPADGWYTRVLVPYLGQSGRYVGLTPDPAAADNDRFAKYFAGLPDAFRIAEPNWHVAGAPVSIMASNDPALAALKGKVDRVLIFREMHNLWRSGVMTTELARIRALLADDGMVGIVQHRAKADAPAEYTDGSNGYLRPRDVIALMEAHGFELVDQSEVNANPKDPANHAEGVWELPPSLGTKRAELKAIGESDRMTMLFRKRA